MLKKIQQDFSYYSHEFKDNYRKGVHRLRTILASRAQAQAFVSNAGGVAVVLGYEPDKPDKNAQELYALLMSSPYIDDAVQTFLGSIYEAGAESQDAMYADNARCLQILHDPVMARAAGAGAVSAGKWIATLAGQSCNAYRDITAVAASATAMNAVAANSPAVAAIFRTESALNIVKSNQSAWATFVACTDGVLTPAVCDLAGLDPTDYADGMTAVAASATAMTAVAASATAIQAIAASYNGIAAIYSNEMALAKWNAVPSAVAAIAGTSSVAIGKAAVKLAGLQPDNFADMAAVAASSTAMAAVAASATAQTALNASTVARTALKASPLATEISLVSSDSQYWNNPGTKTMKGLILATKAGNTDNAFSITKIDSTSTGANQNTRNAATSGSSGYLDWYEKYPNYSWVATSITFYAYYKTTKIKYIPC